MRLGLFSPTLFVHWDKGAAGREQRGVAQRQLLPTLAVV